MQTAALQLIHQLAGNNQTLCTVESCTGGLLFSTLTAIPGASAVLDRGFITYSNQAKQDMVGVSPQTLDEFGAVSAQAATEMACGGQKIAQTSLCASVTGIAGPDGGSINKPVGRVWISAYDEDKRQITECYDFSGDRQQIRQAASESAIALLMCLATQ